MRTRGGGGDTDIRVDASDGTVTLSGHIETWGEHDAVIDATWRGSASGTSATT
jgi:osmotically-inducible protein OsmY